MPSERPPDLNLFLDILRILEGMDAPYMVIGAIAIGAEVAALWSTIKDAARREASRSDEA